jgi:hypothetical protein
VPVSIREPREVDCADKFNRVPDASDRLTRKFTSIACG